MVTDDGTITGTRLAQALLLLVPGIDPATVAYVEIEPNRARVYIAFRKGEGSQKFTIIKG